MGILSCDDWETPIKLATVSDYERTLKLMTNVEFDDLKRHVDAEHNRRYQNTYTSNNTAVVKLIDQRIK